MARYTVNENPFAVQVRVVSALILRETRVTFGAAQLGYVWAIANPVIGTAILTALFSFAGLIPPLGTSFIPFFATGILVFELYTKLANSLMSVFQANKGLMAYPLVKEMDAVYARFLLIVATYLLVLIVFLAGVFSLGLARYPESLLDMLTALLFISLMGLGVGLVNAVIRSLWDTYPQIQGIIMKPMFFISGIFFIPTAFADTTQYLLSWNPILHCIDWFRQGFYPGYQSVILDKWYVFYFTISFLFAGLAGARLFRKKL